MQKEIASWAQKGKKIWRYNNPGGPLEWQEGVSGSSMDTQKAP